MAIAYDAHAGAPAAAADVAGVLETVHAVCAALTALDHDCVHIRVVSVGDLVRALSACDADAVFNLCEGINGDAAMEADAARAIADTGRPFTGTSPGALALARRKDAVNALLRERVPVPRWTLVTPAFDAAADWAHYPAIVKPAGEDAGIGIDSSAVARDADELTRALERARAHAPLIVQQFVDGIELIVGFVGDTALPIAEIDYSGMPAGLSGVVGYAAKWHAGSAEDIGTRVMCPARIDSTLAAQALGTAGSAWRTVAGSGYGRVDLRADVDGVLHVLDVNPNADLAPSAGLARMAAAAGWTFTDLVARILDDALATVHA